MNVLYAAAVLLATAAITARAQRLDGCVEGPTKGVVAAPSDETRDRALQDAGYALKTDSLLSALRDQRADVRSLAAVRLAKDPQVGVLPSLVEALSAERDPCTKAGMARAVAALERASSRGKEGNGRQPRPTPFQRCAPSEPQLVALTLAQSHKPTTGETAPLVHVSVRNLMDRPVPFLKLVSPVDTFSATVLAPTGGHAAIPQAKEYLYHPLPPNVLIGRSGPIEPILGPHEETSWEWRVDEDFDMSTPGKYLVSLGGRIEYLGTTACSNTIEVKIGK